MVAKSYQALPIIKEPFKQNNKYYVIVKTLKGVEKQVRWYNEQEYHKMYPEDDIEVAKTLMKNQKDALGFKKGYITIFKGNTYTYLDWFKSSVCRYCDLWGWYLPSTAEMPQDLPSNLTPLKIEWEKVGNQDNILKTTSEVKNYIDSVIYEKTSSQHIGAVGERLELTLTVIKTNILANNFYGDRPAIMHIMKDQDENEFVWTTSAKQLVENATYKLKGTVKEHKTYRGSNSTILTRCSIQKRIYE